MSITLLCMRLDEMQRVHPHQINGKCAECGAVVGIYPSGQRVLMEHPHAVVVCNHCQDPSANSGLAPGALDEPFQSVKKR